MRLGCASAFANCGRAVAHVRGSYVPISNIHRQKDLKIQTFHSSGSIMSRSITGIPFGSGSELLPDTLGHTMKKSKWVTASPVPRVANCAAAVLPMPSAS